MERNLEEKSPGPGKISNHHLQTSAGALANVLQPLNSERELIFWFHGHGCSTVVEHTPCNQDVMGSNPSWCWAILFFFNLFLLSFNSGVSLIRSLKEVHLKLCV